MQLIHLTMLDFETAEPGRACTVAFFVHLKVTATTSVGATSAVVSGAVRILEASAPTASIANVSTLLEAPVIVWVRLCPLLATAVQIAFTSVVPIRTVALFHTAEPVRACTVAVFVPLDVTLYCCITSVGATCAVFVWAVSILEASAPTASIANVSTLLEAPVSVWVRLRPLLASAIQIVFNSVVPMRTVALGFGSGGRTRGAGACWG